MTKQFFMYDPGGSRADFFDSEAEALAAAETAIEAYRDEAMIDGEWGEYVDGIVVGTITHRNVAQKVAEDSDAVDYVLRPITNQPA